MCGQGYQGNKNKTKINQMEEQKYIITYLVHMY